MKPGDRLGPYEVIGLLGSGGMGEVYQARDTRLGRTVAIKVLPAGVATDPERRRRSEHEARAVSALNHPHICTLHDIGTHTPPDGGPAVDYLVMEFLDGQTLADRLARGPALSVSKGPLPLAEALEYGAQIADALAAAHRQGIVHRDLKPANVMLTSTGVKLLDFGLAKLKPAGRDVLAGASAVTTTAPLTSEGQILGTLPYMAPEQLEGQDVDARSDLFAFGAVLYEMLTGRRAFEGASPASVVAAILEREPPPVSAGRPLTPPALDRLVRTCLAKDPAKRWDSAHDLAEQVRAIAEASAAGTASLPTSAATARGRRWTRRRAFLATAGALVVVAAVAAVFAPRILAPTRRAPVVGGTPSILALPCQVFGAPDDTFLIDAVPATISTLLSGVDGLDTKVPPPSLEVEKIKGDRARLAELYEVSSFIVTSLTASPGRYALNVQLVDAATTKAWWGQQYEGPRDAYNDLARQAAEGIRLAVRPATAPVPAAGVSSEAELAFREGNHFSNRYIARNQRSDFEAALAAYTRALALDPTFASAAGKVAALYMLRFDAEGDVHQTRQEAEKWARDALRIDPRCGEAWGALSAVELFATHADPEKSIDYAARAVAFAPRDARVHANLGMWVGAPGSLSLFTAAFLRSVDLDPLVPYPAATAAVGLTDLGRPEKALPLIDKALRMQPDWPWGLTARGYVLLKLGRLDEAERTLRSCQAEATATHGTGARWRQIRFQLAVAQRDAAMSETLARQVLTQVFDPRTDANLISDAEGFAAPGLARLGRTDDAMRVLLRGIEAGVAPAYDGLVREPDFQRLRGDPRFGKVLAAARDGAALVARILSQARARGELPAYLEKPLDELVQLLKENEGRH